VFSPTIGKRLQRLGLIDEIDLQLAPVLLGDGIRLYDAPGGEPVHLQRADADPNRPLAFATPASPGFSVHDALLAQPVTVIVGVPAQLDISQLPSCRRAVWAAVGSNRSGG
jgi:hypothetical protein